MGVANISSILSEISRFLYGSLINFLLSFMKSKNNDQEETENNEETNNDQKKEKVIEGIISKKSNLSTSIQNLPNDKNESIEQIGDDDDDGNEEDDEKVSVPLFLVFITFGSYLYIGAVIFSNIESWTDYQSAYFSYVSLSTMGKF
jgi:hypothetical protein